MNFKTMALLPIFSHVQDSVLSHLQRANLVLLKPFYNDVRCSIMFSVSVSLDVMLFIAEELVLLTQYKGLQNEFIKRMGPTWKGKIRSIVICQFCQVLYFYKTYTEYGTNTLVLEHFTRMYPGVKLPGIVFLLNIVNTSREILRISPFGFLTLEYCIPKSYIDDFLNPAWHKDTDLGDIILFWSSLSVPFNDPQVANDCLVYKLLIPELVLTIPQLSIIGSPHYCIGDIIWYNGSFMILEAAVSQASMAFNFLFSTEIVIFKIDGFEVGDLWQRVQSALPRVFSASYKPLIFEWATGINFNSGMIPIDLSGSGGEIPIPPVPAGTGFGTKTTSSSGGNKNKGSSEPGPTSSGGKTGSLGRRGGSSSGPGGPSPKDASSTVDSGRELKSHPTFIEEVREASAVESAADSTLSTINNVYNSVVNSGGRTSGVSTAVDMLYKLANTAINIRNLAINGANYGTSTIGGSINLPGLTISRSERRRITT